MELVKVNLDLEEINIIMQDSRAAIKHLARGHIQEGSLIEK